MAGNSSSHGDTIQPRKSHEKLKSQQRRWDNSAERSVNERERERDNVGETGKDKELADIKLRNRLRVRKGMRRDSFENAQGSYMSNDSPRQQLNYLLKKRNDVDTLPVPGNITQETWISEHIRSMATDINTPWMTLMQDYCECGDMRVDQSTTTNALVCVAHSTHRTTPCSALEYSLHNLNSVVADVCLITSSDLLDTLDALDTLTPDTQDTQKRCLRKLARIIAHFYSNHRDMFLVCESETGLARRISRLAKRYNILPPYILIWDGDMDAYLDMERESELGDDMCDLNDFKPRRTPAQPSRQLFDVGPVSGEGDDEDSDDYSSDDD
ncbi:hypothetical protein E3P77_03313 [Wallemia ichthyophaga]|nr:hypothetical protein E3P77_03313 [Wallemia ichthyophaga]